MNAMAFRMGAVRYGGLRISNPWELMRAHYPQRGLWLARAVMDYWDAKRRQLYHHLAP